MRKRTVKGLPKLYDDKTYKYQPRRRRRQFKQPAYVTVVIDQELKDTLAEQAYAEGLRLSEYIRRILTEAVKNAEGREEARE